MLIPVLPPIAYPHPSSDCHTPNLVRVRLMFSIEEFIIAVLCCVDDALAKLTQGQTTGFAPALSDSEVLTIEIGRVSRLDAVQAIWQ